MIKISINNNESFDIRIQKQLRALQGETRGLSLALKDVPIKNTTPTLAKDFFYIGCPNTYRPHKVQKETGELKDFGKVKLDNSDQYFYKSNKKQTAKVSQTDRMLSHF